VVVAPVDEQKSKLIGTGVVAVAGDISYFQLKLFTYDYGVVIDNCACGACIHGTLTQNNIGMHASIFSDDDRMTMTDSADCMGMTHVCNSGNTDNHWMQWTRSVLVCVQCHYGRHVQRSNLLRQCASSGRFDRSRPRYASASHALHTQTGTRKYKERSQKRAILTQLRIACTGAVSAEASVAWGSLLQGGQAQNVYMINVVIEDAFGNNYTCECMAEPQTMIRALDRCNGISHRTLTDALVRA
jgi:hypothetical protein